MNFVKNLSNIFGKNFDFKFSKKKINDSLILTIILLLMLSMVMHYFIHKNNLSRERILKDVTDTIREKLFEVNDKIDNLDLSCPECPSCPKCPEQAACNCPQQKECPSCTCPEQKDCPSCSCPEQKDCPPQNSCPEQKDCPPQKDCPKCEKSVTFQERANVVKTQDNINDSKTNNPTVTVKPLLSNTDDGSGITGMDSFNNMFSNFIKLDLILLIWI